MVPVLTFWIENKLLYSPTVLYRYIKIGLFVKIEYSEYFVAISVVPIERGHKL